MSSESEIDVSLITFVIHIEFSNETIEYSSNSDKFIESACKEMYHILKSKHIPITEPPHELFYNPNLPENVAIKQRRAATNLVSARGPRGSKVTSPVQVSSGGNSLLQIATKNATKGKNANSSWRALAGVLKDEVEIKNELPEDEIDDIEEQVCSITKNFLK